MRGLQELIRQLTAAASACGMEALVAKLEEAMRLLTRDIVFAGSLYLV